MSLSPLAAKLQAHATLLPSQRELLERVLFQIEFNGFQHIHLIGGTGSGKTTLSLVLAELLSDAMNLAYFSSQPDMTTTQCQKHLLQQWFGLSEFETNLMELLEQPHPQPLVWILDSQGSLPLGCLSLLRAHPIHIITTGPDVLTEAELNLAISPVTEAEAEQLLPVQMLQTRSAAERLQAAAGNLHRLLEPEVVSERSDSKPVAMLAQKYRTASLVLAVLGVVAILLFWWLSQPSEPELLLADNQPRPVVQAWSPADVVVSEAEPGQTDVDNRLPNETSADDTLLTDAEALHLTESIAAGEQELMDEPALEIPSAVPAMQPETTEQLASAEQSAMAGQTAITEHPEDVAPGSDTILLEPNAWPYDEAKLLAMNEDHYVLQLGAFANLNAAQAVRQSYPELTVLIYQRQHNGQSQWVVVLAAYRTAEQARAIRAEIPAALRAETPFIKSMQQVWQEIRSSQPGQGNHSQ
ncbi:SPOR domain-containing protein [Alkalimonas sp.]|uniref:SPOR domain-containing protein n=1 Tax=Alkalimonas sp. TaxID=1872453 RepID=UPI00263A86E8|nr:SPOR domain-containing protein [Alkalimonas sp.]MCC5826101.1 SPOR domain-containing protein [Alkalimonas sp.]